jgi:hypothetical protein
MANWTEDEDRTLTRLREGGLSFPQIAEEIPGRSASACRNRFNLLDGEEEENEPLGPSALDEWKAQSLKPTWEEILEYAEKGAELHRQMRPIYTRATRTIRTKEPVFLVHMSDFHLGARGTDYRYFIETTKLIMSDPRFYIVITGKDLELAFAWFRSAEAILGQVLPPWMQIEAFKLWLEEMLPRTVAVCGDNHGDERLERKLGDIGLMWDERVPYFRTYGILTLEVGDETYEALLTHRYKGSSVYHDLQPALRTMREIYPTADWYATSHTHVPAYMAGVYYPEARPATMPEQHFIVSGSFKVEDDLYAMRNHGGSGVLGLPTLMLYPDRHEIVYFRSPETALQVAG